MSGTGSGSSTTCLVQDNASLRRYNTFGVDVRARWLARLRVAQALPELLDRPAWRGAPVLVLGEGSNVLFRADFDGLVVKLDNQRVDIVSEDERGTLLRAEAGRNWHSLVGWTLDRGLEGLENLALIPGTVGAAPVQNIGAYGVELDTMIEAVEAWDTVAREMVVLPREACGFAYRDSVFKSGPGHGRHVITAVRFVLPREHELVLHYPGVREELAALGHAVPTARDVHDAIASIRRRKLPDPAVLGNAGSFFKNPIVDSAFAEGLRTLHPTLPTYPAAPGQTKLSAAWLIEQCRWRGHREGDAGVADSHALVLVNHGHASGTQLFALAERIRDSVTQRFGVTLEPEPHVI